MRQMLNTELRYHALDSNKSRCACKIQLLPWIGQEKQKRLLLHYLVITLPNTEKNNPVAIDPSLHMHTPPCQPLSVMSHPNNWLPQTLHILSWCLPTAQLETQWWKVSEASHLHFSDSYVLFLVSVKASSDTLHQCSLNGDSRTATLQLSNSRNGLSEQWSVVQGRSDGRRQVAKMWPGDCSI